MALNERDEAGATAEGRGAGDRAAPAAAPPPAAPVGRAAPAWLTPLYLGGLALVYVGQRVLSEAEGLASAASWLGVALAVLATGFRFSPRFRVGGDRKEAEQLLGMLSLLGLVALGGYGLTTTVGQGWLGLATAAPAVAERWLGVLTAAWVALLVLAGVPMVFAEAALLPMRRAARIEARRVRAAVTAGGALALAAVYSALFVFASTGLPWKADFSYFKTSAASESTRKVAQSFTQPLRVVAFYPTVNEIRPEVEGYLRELAAGVPNLQVEVQDRLLSPKLAKELKVTQDGVIVVALGETTQTLSIGTDERSARPKLKTLDRDFQEQLLKLARSRRTAYLTTGHGEVTDPPRGGGANLRAARAVRTVLQKQNYLVKELGLSQGLGSDVPRDADLVLVLGPTEPFLPEELAALRRYADRAGRLFIAIDPEALTETDAAPEGAPAPPPVASDAPAGSAAPVGSAPPPAGSAPMPAGSGSAAPPAPAAAPASPWEGLAAVVGLTVVPGVVANESTHLRRTNTHADRTLLVTNRYSSHAAVSTLSRNAQRAPAIFAGAAALERASGATEKVDFAVKAMPSSFADENRNFRMEPAEKKTNFNLAAAVSRPTGAPAPAPAPVGSAAAPAGGAELRAIVLGDADAITDVVLSNSVPNQLLLMDSIRWLGGEESFSGEVNNEEDVRIEHTKQKDQVWFYGTIFGVPGLVLGVGLLLARRTRRATGGAS